MEQRTPEWYLARCGKFTASRISDLCSTTPQKRGRGAGFYRYVGEVTVERLTGAPMPENLTPAMRWGIDQEEFAALNYELTRGVSVAPAGFVDHPRIPMSGASPDLYVGDDGLVEIKCPETHTHIRYVLGAPIPREYVYQMQWQLECTERAWCDWISYDPRFSGGDIPVGAEMIVRRVHRDEAVIDEIRKAVRLAHAEAEKQCRQIRDWRPG